MCLDVCAIKDFSCQIEVALANTALCSWQDSLAVSGEGLPRNWMILLGHRRLQYIGEEPLGVAGG
jgi:hypothetical protein